MSLLIRFLALALMVLPAALTAAAAATVTTSEEDFVHMEDMAMWTRRMANSMSEPVSFSIGSGGMEPTMTPTKETRHDEDMHPPAVSPEGQQQDDGSNDVPIPATTPSPMEAVRKGGHDDDDGMKGSLRAPASKKGGVKGMARGAKTGAHKKMHVKDKMDKDDMDSDMKGVKSGGMKGHRFF